MTNRLRGLLPKALEVLTCELEGEHPLPAAVHVLKACGLYGMLKACHDLLYISGDFRRLYPVGTNSKSISCEVGKGSCAGRLNDRGRYSTKASCEGSGSSEPWGDAKRVG
jgi:hypothetical protein